MAVGYSKAPYCKKQPWCFHPEEYFAPKPIKLKVKVAAFRPLLAGQKWAYTAINILQSLSKVVFAAGRKRSLYGCIPLYG
jgi:hypothetical protein